MPCNCSFMLCINLDGGKKLSNPWMVRNFSPRFDWRYQFFLNSHSKKNCLNNNDSNNLKIQCIFTGYDTLVQGYNPSIYFLSTSSVYPWAEADVMLCNCLFMLLFMYKKSNWGKNCQTHGFLCTFSRRIDWRYQFSCNSHFRKKNWLSN